MSDFIVFDTSVLVDNLRTGRHSRRFASVTGLVRTSSVVLAELCRGAAQTDELELLRALEKGHPVWTPTESNWLESGRLLAEIRDDQGFEPAKLRDLHFDLLIALTARSHGARLISSNRADFELIREYRDFKLEIW